MGTLEIEPNLALPDDFYAALIQAHEGKSDEESADYNARLILVLANHIGDHAILTEALKAAQ